MSHKQFKSTALVSLLALSSACSAMANETITSKTSKMKTPGKNKSIASIIKYSALASAVLVSAGLGYLYLGRPQLESDLKVESEIINYIDGDDISLTSDEIKKYSPAYSRFLSNINNDYRLMVRHGKIFKECALFLIRSHARLIRQNKKISDNIVDSDTNRYKQKNNSYYACTLSKPYLRTPKDDNYLAYLRDKKDMTVLVGLGGWEIKANLDKFDLYYDKFDSFKHVPLCYA